MQLGSSSIPAECFAPTVRLVRDCEAPIKMAAV